MRKKKRSRASKKGSGGVCNAAPPPQSNQAEEEEKHKVVESLVEAFGTISVEEAEAAYNEAKGDVNKAAEILGDLYVKESSTEDQSTSCSSSSGNFASTSSGSGSSGSSSASEVFAEANVVCPNGVRNQKGRQKKVVAAAGIVSTVLGKDYVRSVTKKSSSKSKGSWNKEDVEQFLFSMLGEDCELGMPVVSDVLCGCGYDVEKALNILLELSSSLGEQTHVGNANANIREDASSNLEGNSSLTDRTSDSTSYSSESDFPKNAVCTEHIGRSHFQVLAGIDNHSSKNPAHMEPDLSQQVLESLFNMPTPKSAEREPNTMNWRKIVKKMTSLGQGTHPGDGALVRNSLAKGDDYQVFRQSAKQHWESMKFCYQKAASAFSNGERDYAAVLSEKGRTHSKMAREAEEKASQDIFQARNKGIENMITIDLHGQHVKEAMRLLKLHLLFGAYVRSVRSLRIITGCGRHGVGKSQLKQSVINLLKKEGIEWSEENSGTLLISRLDQQTQFSFLDSDNEGE
ncbi:SMR domain-containing protein At5g58720-like [Coffea arabica]|uniref:SMR domain-containing protein At5g58720-like n=1 Tax=Coffea arabica TaxID=13443 RepID=A0A6P6W964_COFAR